MDRWALGLLAVVGAVGCAGTQPRGDGFGDEARPTDRPCAVSVSPSSPSSPSPSSYGDGRIDVRVSCGLPLTPADSRDFTLVALERAGGPAEVRDSDLRATAEYRSLMDPRNVWQWGDRVTDAEALAACRLILGDLRAGLRVRWELRARSYLARARAAGTMPGTMPGPQGRGVPDVQDLPSSTSAPHRRGRTPTPPAASGTAGGVPGQRPQVEVGQVLDRAMNVLPAIRWRGDDRTARLLERVLSIAAVHTASLGVVLSGATITIAVTTGGGTVEFVVVTGGAAPVNMKLAAALSQPLLQALAGELRQIDAITADALVAQAGGAQGTAAQLPAWPARARYHELIYRPTEQLGRGELEEIHHLELELARHGVALEPADAGSAAHKARTWARYQARRGEWPFERWSPNYEQNMVRASDAHRLADHVHAQLGWGQREARVVFEGYDGTRQLRVLDIGDTDDQRGVEVKSGYVYYSPEIAAQITKDATLISEYEWTITWYVEGRISEPARQALRAGGIPFTETKPNTPIKDLRR